MNKIQEHTDLHYTILTPKTSHFGTIFTPILHHPLLGIFQNTQDLYKMIRTSNEHHFYCNFTSSDSCYYPLLQTYFDLHKKYVFVYTSLHQFCNNIATANTC